ncbi:MAG TPA: diacylglycerol kinase family protein [Streptosporangiaceae bacterium]|nr:diacylglycerol kinase family protein [Streptosporangiaceae bacterium]
MRTKAELERAIRSGGPAVLIVNTRSRRGRRLFATARRRVAAGVRLAAVLPVPDPDELGGVFRTALALQPDLIIVGGGDGTLKEAVGHLVHRDIALGVLPLGTTNNFARSLGLPLRLSGAAGVIRHGKVADVDAGVVSRAAAAAAAEDSFEEVFANMVSLGMSVAVAERAPARLKRVVGRTAYALTALHRMPVHRPFHATVRAGGDTFDFVTHQLNIANGAHHSGRLIAGDAGPDDRRLAVYRLGDERRKRLAGATLRHMLVGYRRSLDEEAFITTREVHVETDPPMPVDVDGEIRGRTPLTVTLLPNALRVMVPRDFVDT